MKIKLYQINPDRDKGLQIFRSLDTWPELNGKPAVDSRIYDKVFDGEIREAMDVEYIFVTFNLDHPTGYCGRSMSVSDVLEIVEAIAYDPGFYYCDTIGFKKIDFDPRQ